MGLPKQSGFAMHDHAADPSAAGEFNRNGDILKYFEELVANRVALEEYSRRVHIHFSDFTNFGSNAPGTGFITKAITRARIVITDAVLTDWGEIYAPVYSHGAQLCHIDSKACWMHTRLTVHDDNFAGADQAEIECGWVRYLGANVHVGFRITFQRDDASNTVTYRFYAQNAYWTGAAYATTTSVNPVLTLTFTSDSRQSADLFFYSTGSNLYCWADWDTSTVQTVAVGDDNNQGSAEVDFWLKRQATGFNLDMEINQWTFNREW